jgi:2-oxoglutarate dehydrogenase E2 component (dihydrolipoamide succinyltransferase)
VAHEPGSSRAIELTVPELGPAGEATVTSWIKSPGDVVELDEPICRIRVEGMEMEVCSSAAGRVSMIVAHAGEAVRDGDTLAAIAAQEADEEPFAPEPDVDLAASPGPEPHPDWSPEPFPPPEDEPAAKESLPVEPITFAEEPVGPEPPPEEPIRTGLPGFGDDVDWSHWHSPVVKLLAEEHGVDLSQVQGTGIDGRIRKRDVLAHLESENRD